MTTAPAILQPRNLKESVNWDVLHLLNIFPFEGDLSFAKFKHLWVTLKYGALHHCCPSPASLPDFEQLMYSVTLSHFHIPSEIFRCQFDANHVGKVDAIPPSQLPRKLMLKRYVGNLIWNIGVVYCLNCIYLSQSNKLNGMRRPIRIDDASLIDLYAFLESVDAFILSSEKCRYSNDGRSLRATEIVSSLSSARNHLKQLFSRGAFVRCAYVGPAIVTHAAAHFSSESRLDLKAAPPPPPPPLSTAAAPLLVSNSSYPTTALAASKEVAALASVAADTQHFRSAMTDGSDDEFFDVWGFICDIWEGLPKNGVACRGRPGSEQLEENTCAAAAAAVAALCVDAPALPAAAGISLQERLLIQRDKRIKRAELKWKRALAKQDNDAARKALRTKDEEEQEQESVSRVSSSVPIVNRQQQQQQQQQQQLLRSRKATEHACAVVTPSIKLPAVVGDDWHEGAGDPNTYSFDLLSMVDNQGKRSQNGKVLLDSAAREKRAETLTSSSSHDSKHRRAQSSKSPSVSSSVVGRGRAQVLPKSKSRLPGLPVDAERDRRAAAVAAARPRPSETANAAGAPPPPPSSVMDILLQLEESTAQILSEDTRTTLYAARDMKTATRIRAAHSAKKRAPGSAAANVSELDGASIGSSLANNRAPAARVGSPEVSSAQPSKRIRRPTSAGLSTVPVNYDVLAALESIEFLEINLQPS